MTNTEFATLHGFIAAGCGKSLSTESQLAYFEMLKDIPADVGMLAATRVLAEHRFASFPTIAELRAAAADTVRGQVTATAPAEAWDIAWRIIQRTDPDRPGSFERACKIEKAPPLVIDAIHTFGILDLCYGKESVGVLRGQFLKTFEQLAARDRRAALLPAGTHAALKDIRDRQALAAPARLAIEGIGKEVT